MTSKTFRPHLSALSILAFSLSCSVPALADSSDSCKLTINSIEISPESKQLLITGKCFNSAATTEIHSGKHVMKVASKTPAHPSVSLGDQALEIVDFSESKISVKLPNDVQPATYRLTVSNSNSTNSKASLYFQVDGPAVNVASNQ